MKLIIAFLACIVSLAAGAQSGDTLTNKSIIDLTKAKISATTQKTMIASSPCTFSVDTKSIIDLKKSGVADEVINAMIDKMKASHGSTGDANAGSGVTIVDMLLTEGSGIYYELPDSTIQELDPSIFSQSKQGSFLGAALTYGLAKSKQKMSVSGKSANLQLSQQSPTFYFVFNAAEKNLNQQNPSWFAEASSPNEFVLVKFTGTRNNNREITTGSVGTYSGAVQGIDDKQKKSFQFTKLAKGVYKISFDTPLESGEYCFMYAGALVQYNSNPKVYDFGVK
ncbi:MAG: hypothetical protein V4721_06665 [Bacteroidota bacterium]